MPVDVRHPIECAAPSGCCVRHRAVCAVGCDVFASVGESLLCGLNHPYLARAMAGLGLKWLKSHCSVSGEVCHLSLFGHELATYEQCIRISAMLNGYRLTGFGLNHAHNAASVSVLCCADKRE